MKPDPRIEAFLADLRLRLYRGRATYGDRSFRRPLAELVQELRQEADDLIGWTFPLRVRLAELERIASEIDRRTASKRRPRP